jgi:hypothetical protein
MKMADAFRINSAKVTPQQWRAIWREHGGGWPQRVMRYQSGMGEFDVLFTPSPLDTLCYPLDGPMPKGTARYRWERVAEGVEAGYLIADWRLPIAD